MNLPILDSRTLWQCPSCDYQQISPSPRHQPGHACPSLKGFSVPLAPVPRGKLELPKNSRPRHRLVEREDYVGKAKGVLYSSNGRAISSVYTERPDGSNDVHVFAPIATATVNKRGEILDD